LRYILSKHRCN